MNDRAISLLEQYDIEDSQVRKGRGSFIIESEGKTFIFKEFKGSEEKLKLINDVLSRLQELELKNIESIVPTKEDQLIVKDLDESKYILKTHFPGRESDSQSREECIDITAHLAKLHNELMKIEIPDNIVIGKNLRNAEFEKRSREIKRVRRFLKEKSQKNVFELKLLASYDVFLSNAFDVTRRSVEFDEERGNLSQEYTFCHGDYQYHNVINMNGELCLVNFEKLCIDNPVRDLHLLLRKLMEKNNWDIEYGKRLIDAYESIRPLSRESVKDLYFRLLYPEKFWKIINFYNNSPKTWIPDKNIYKLEKLISLENSKLKFIETVFE